MILPDFVKSSIRTYPCPKCKQVVVPGEKIATEVGLKKRPEMNEPSVTVTVECPYCGTACNVGLGGTIPWPDLLNWLIDFANRHHAAEAPNGLAAATDIPKNERLWLRLDDHLWMFRLIGAYRRGQTTYALVRRIPMQPCGFDGRVWDGVLRLKREQQAGIVGEDDPLHLPLGEWNQFLGFPSGFQFKIGGMTFRKLSPSALRDITQKGTLVGVGR